MKTLLIVLGFIVWGSCASAQQVGGSTIPPGSSGRSTIPRENHAIGQNPINTVPVLSPEDEYQLLKLKALQDSEDDLLKWAQTRFWYGAAIVACLSLIGIPAIVRQMLSTEVKEAMRASADAQAAAASGHEAIRDVRAEAAKYKELVEMLSTTAKGLDEKFREITSRIDAEGARTSAGADLKISALDQQINQIREMISRLATETRHEAQDWAQHQRTIEEVRESAATSESEFADNSKFRVIVVGALPDSATVLGSLTSSIVNALSLKGFKARIGIYGGDETDGLIRIDYDESAKRKVQEVQKIVEDAVARGNYPHRNIQTGQRPQSKEEDQIRVFL